MMTSTFNRLGAMPCRMARPSFLIRTCWMMSVLLTLTPNTLWAITWNSANPGNLLTGSNWGGGVAPNGVGAVATFNSNPTNSGDFTLNGSMTLGTLAYSNHTPRSINGTGTLTFQSSSGNALFHITSDANRLELNVASVVLASTTEFRIENFLQIYSPIGGSGGGLTKSGAGALELIASNTYTGPTTISAGTLRLWGGELIPNASALSISSGATFDMNGYGETVASLSGSGNVTNNNILLITGGNNTSTTFSGTISGSGGLTKTGSGITTLSGSNSYSGTTTISGGTLRGNSIANNGASSAFGRGNFNISGGATLEYTGGTASTNRTVSLNTGGGSINISSAATSLTISGAITGVGNDLYKTGPGKLILSGSSSYSTNRIMEGTLSGNSIENNGTNSAFGRGNFVISNAAMLEYTGGSKATDRMVTIGDDGGRISVTNSDAILTWNGVISGAGGLDKTGSGTLVLTGLNTFSDRAIATGSGSIMSGNTIAPLGQASAFGAGDLGVRQGATLRYTGSTASTDRGLFIGFGGGTVDVSNSDTMLTMTGIVYDNVGRDLAKSGSGTLALTGLNTYSGANIITGGALSGNSIANNGSDSAFGRSDFAISNGATLEYTGGTASTNRTIALGTDGGTMSVTNVATNLTVSGTITGSSNLTKTGSGKLTLTGVNTYGGHIMGGTLSGNSIANTGSPSALGTGNFGISNGATLEYTGATASSNRIINLDNSGTISVASSGTVLTLNRTGTHQIRGTGDLMTSGPGIVRLDGTADHSGSTNIASGTLRLGNQERLPDGSNLHINSSGTFDMNGFGETFGSLSGEGSVINNHLNLHPTFNSGSAIYSGTISGSGGVGKHGTGHQTFTGNNAYTGNTVITGGTLSGNTIADNGTNSAFGRGNFSISNGATLGYTGGSASTDRTVNLGTGGGAIGVTNSGALLTWNGLISGTGGLTKTGSGMMTLTDNNSYQGGTTISAGTLLANNTTGSATGSGTVTVNGGTLGGTGSIGGPVEVNGGTLAPGASIESLYLSSDLTLSAGVFEWEFDSDNLFADLVDVQGSLFISPNTFLSGIDFGNTLLPNGTKFTLISYRTAGDPGMFAGMFDDTLVTVGGQSFLINYDDTVLDSVNGGTFANAITLTAVPEPSTCIVLALSVAALIAWRRSVK